MARQRKSEPPTPRAAFQKIGAHAQSILEWALDAVITMDHRGHILGWNPQAEALFGWKREDVFGRLLADFIVPERHRDAHRAGLQRFLQTGEGPLLSKRVEITALRRGGEEFDVEINIIPESTGRGWVFTAFVRDISERRRKDAALRESEELFRSAFRHASTGFCLTGLDGRFLRVNPALCQVLGYSEEELLARTFTEVTHPEEREESVLLARRLIEGTRESGALVKRYVRKDGRHVWALVTATLVRGADGAPKHFVTQVEDITRRKAAEDALRVSEKTYRMLFEDHPTPMYVYERTAMRILAVNEAMVSLYGYTRAEFRAMTIYDIRPPEEVPRLKDAMRAYHPGYRFVGEWIHRHKDGSLLLMEAATHGIRFEGQDATLVMLRDVTERRRQDEALRRTQEQLSQAARMEAVGRLAGGIAHDFNNLLTIIQGYGQLLTKKAAKGEAAAQELEEIRYAAMRGNSLTQQLLAFSRKQVLRPKVLDLNAVVATMEQLLRRVIGEHIELTTSLEPGVSRVKADPGQLDQVIMNLALNARDAMPSGGRLGIATGMSDREPGGPWATLSVSDTGTGMDEETRAHIFEPFFTTKEGRGTGLGLATVYGIVQQSGGQIRVASEPGRGTIFRIFLPPAAEPAEPREAAAGAHRKRGSETVLLVEDEPRVRALAARILAESGYSVLQAPAGGEALRMASDHPGTIHLLLTDVVLPDLNGSIVAERFAAARPGSRVLFMSGYPDLAEAGSLPAGAQFLPKPFTDDVLTSRVREVLDGAPA